MRILFSLLLTIIITKNSQSQDWHGSSFHEAMCGAISCETGFKSIGLNPAGSAFSKLGGAVSYNNRFQMKELSQKAAQITIPAGFGVFSSSIDYYGFQLFNQTKTSLGYAMQLSSIICAGVNLNYHGIHIDDSPANFHAVSSDIGIICKPTPNLKLGAFVNNITNSQYETCDSILPTQIQIGTLYKFFGGHYVSLDFEKSTLISQIKIHGAVNGHLNEKFSIMAGFETAPLIIGFGTEFRFEKLLMIFAARRNQYLGWILSSTIGWRILDNDIWDNQNRKI